MLLPIRVINYSYSLTTVFPATLPVAPGLTILKPSIDNYDEASGMLRQLVIVDYRYSRLVVDPRTGLFSLVRWALQSCLFLISG
jgi:cation-transporting ATPase 13A3/4/5